MPSPGLDLLSFYWFFPNTPPLPCDLLPQLFLFSIIIFLPSHVFFCSAIPASLLQHACYTTWFPPVYYLPSFSCAHAYTHAHLVLRLCRVHLLTCSLWDPPIHAPLHCGLSLGVPLAGSYLQQACVLLPPCGPYIAQPSPSPFPALYGTLFAFIAMCFCALPPPPCSSCVLLPHACACATGSAFACVALFLVACLTLPYSVCSLLPLALLPVPSPNCALCLPSWPCCLVLPYAMPPYLTLVNPYAHRFFFYPSPFLYLHFTPYCCLPSFYTQKNKKTEGRKEGDRTCDSQCHVYLITMPAPLHLHCYWPWLWVLPSLPAPCAKSMPVPYLHLCVIGSFCLLLQHNFFIAHITCLLLCLPALPTPFAQVLPHAMCALLPIALPCLYSSCPNPLWPCMFITPIVGSLIGCMPITFLHAVYYHYFSHGPIVPFVWTPFTCACCDYTQCLVHAMPVNPRTGFLPPVLSHLTSHLCSCSHALLSHISSPLTIYSYIWIPVKGEKGTESEGRRKKKEGEWRAGQGRAEARQGKAEAGQAAGGKMEGMG